MGAPLTVTRLHWRAEDALPFELDLTVTHVSANLVPATAGLTSLDHVAIDSPPPDHPELPTTVERGGPYDPDAAARAIIHRRSLPLSADLGLGWLYADDPPPLGAFPLPEILIEEVQPDAGPPEGFAAGAVWSFHREILRTGELDHAFTVEPGTWREVISFDRLGLRITHADYAGNAGTTVRFGDGTFGRRPVDDTLFRITYRTGPGRRANVPADTIVHLSPPVGAAEGAAAPALSGISAVRNPLPVTGGRDPEDMELARRIMPEAFRALTFRAVLDEDFEEIAERLAWVQQAGAVSRWTGSWLTTFVTPDPLGSFTLSDERRAELEDLMDCVRQAGREVHVSDPVFVDIDLDDRALHRARRLFRPGAGTGHPRAHRPRAASARRCRSSTPTTSASATRCTGPSSRPRSTPCRASSRSRRSSSAGAGRPITSCSRQPRSRSASDRILRLRNDPRRPDQGSLRVRLRADVAA